MSNPEDTNWEFFGFPHPGFLLPWKPCEGLWKALAERQLPFSQTWDFDAIAGEDILKVFQTHGSGQAWCRSYDSALQSVAVRYLNHTKVNLQNASGITDLSDAMWTWEELLLEAAYKKEKEIADPAKGDLSADWNLDWLKQRKKAIDLLLYAPVIHQYEYLSGSTHTGEPSSPAEAIQAAIGSMSPFVSSGGLPSTYVNNIYGPDHGWREGSYCCNVAVTTRIMAKLPEGMESTGDVFLVIQVTGADGTDESFQGGGDLHIGVNVLTADKDGLFIEFPEDSIAGIAGTPARDHETSGGWRSTMCTAFANYEKLFYFKAGA